MAAKLLAICASIALISITRIAAIELNIDDHVSIQRAASTVAYGMMKYYHGNETGQTPGLLPEPYFWWEAGAMFGALVDYWHYTGDSTYNHVVSEAMLLQASPGRNFEPENQTMAEGNDDQAFWAITALMAAEAGFPNPPPDKPQWLALAEAVFERQAERWDYATCGGGLRWQIHSFNKGYGYKNSISQGGFFNIAVRLGAFTNNQTYYQWADKVYAWCESVGLIGPTFQVYDGSDSLIDCSRVDHTLWSYNAGIFLHSSAVMWNQTSGSAQQVWRNRTEGFLHAALDTFFVGPNKTIMWESTCEDSPDTKAPRQPLCNNDQRSFKAYLSRWLGATSKLAPWTAPIIKPYLRASALAAAQSCSGGTDGVTCGQQWWSKGWDGNYGVGEQMCALETIQSNLASRAKGPLSSANSGTSKGSSGAGGGSAGDPGTHSFAYDDLNKSDRAGAIALTVGLVVTTLGVAWWIAV